MNSPNPLARAACIALLLVAVTLIPAAQADGVPSTSPAIALSASSLALTEGGATATYNVHLSTPPGSASLTVTIASPNGQVRFLKGATWAATTTLSFSPANYSTDQAVTVSAVDDAAVEGTHGGNITHTPASTDPVYGSVRASLPVTITDNDLGLAVVQTGTGTSVNEKPAPAAADQDTFSLALGSAPAQNVVVHLSPDTQLSVSQLTVTFTPANWKVPKSITVVAANDFVAQPVNPYTRSIAISTTSSDTAYNGLSTSLPVSILDDDVAGWRFATLTGSDGTLNTLPSLAAITEGGSTGYKVHLNSQPTANVVLTPSGPVALTFTPASLTFTPANWNTAQAIGIADATDAIDQGASYTVSVAQAAASTDPQYTSAPSPITFTINDPDDVANVLLTATGGSTTVMEGGATDTVNVALATQPVATVTVTLTGPGDVAFSPSSLTFTAANWNVAQSSTVSAVDDTSAELSKSVTITATASSTDIYNAKTATLSVTVNDDDGVLAIVQSGGSTTAAEGGSDTFTVALIGNPPSDVTVTLASSLPSQFTVSPTTLTFKPTTAGGNPCPTADNVTKDCTWNKPQTVTFTPVNDDRVDGTATGTITFAVTGGFTDTHTHPLAVSATDNDAAGYTLSASTVTVAEGGSATYTVKLTSQPAADVTVTPAGTGDAHTSPASLVFTAANWATAQTVTVNVPQDSIDKGSTAYAASVTHTVSSTDPLYAAPPGAVAVTINDDDIAGYVFNGLARNTLPTAATFNEGGSGTYTVKLNSQPTSDVTLTFTPNAGGVATPSSWTFNAANWNVAKTVTIAVADNSVDQSTGDPGTYALNVAQAVSSTDPLYASVQSPVPFTVNENDRAGVIVAETAGSTIVMEGGATDTVSVVLRSEPVAPVTLNVPNPGGAQASPSTLTFTAANWNVGQTVTLTAVDDSVAEFEQTSQWTLAVSATTDALYTGLSSTAVTVRVGDNDGVLVLTLGSPDMTVAEGGATAVYSVRLIGNPTGQVNVTVSSPGGQLLFNNQASLVLHFMPQSAASGPAADARVPCPGVPAPDPTKDCHWNHPQNVTVKANADGVAEGPMSVLVSNAASSVADGRFNGQPASQVLVPIIDGDAALFVHETGSGTAVQEGGAADSYTLSLSTPPSFSVAVSLSVDSRVAVSPSTLYFDADNWNDPQTVTVLAPNDNLDQPDVVTYAIHHAITSGDSRYNVLTPVDVSVAVTDDDTAGLQATQTGAGTSVTEAGPSDTYTLALASQPSANVNVALSSTGPASVSPTSLTFTAANWNVPQTVTVTAVDDSIAQGARSASIHHAVTSTDAAYNGVAVADIPVAVADNDAAGVVVAQTAGSTIVNEGGQTDTFTVRLASQPVEDVTVTLAPDAQLSLSVGQLTFTAANWNTPQSVTVSAPNDDIARTTPHGVPVGFSVASADGGYQGLAVPSLGVTINDNDRADILFNAFASSLTATEGGAGSWYAFRLTSQPSADVTVQVLPDGQVSVSPASLTFTPVNWKTYQNVMVGAVDDAVHEGAHTGSIAHTATSADPMYQGLAPPALTVSITDND
jgi:hypothetical protein